MSSRNKAPRTKYQHRIKYDFLCYSRLVFRWAYSNTDLSKPEIELLLYLYGQGLFSKRQFSKFYSTLSLYANKGLKELVNRGWIIVFREGTDTESKLYTLTTKGKKLCSRMHNMCSGEEAIPTTERNNKMTGSGKKLDRFYLDIIKKMNKDRNK